MSPRNRVRPPNRAMELTGWNLAALRERCCAGGSSPGRYPPRTELRLMSHFRVNRYN